MAQTIAVLHSEFDFGGGEAVCFQVLEALRDDYDVTLFTLDDDELEANADQFDYSLGGHEVVSFDRTGTALQAANRVANAATGDAFGTQHPLKAAVLQRRVRGHLDEFDLVIGTKSEVALPSPTIQYVHRPLFNRHRARDPFGTDGIGSYYQRFVTRAAGVGSVPADDDTIVTNSSWTANHLRELYGVDPTVVHPPVDVGEFEPTPWAEKENGFVAIGRISPDKNVEQGIEIVEAVRDRGFPVHLHIVGPPNERRPDYYSKIRSVAEESDAVHLEGKLTRDELVGMVNDHRWGLHTKPSEHFGIAVAELVAGGTVPFVPNSGGQAEIVGQNELLRYESVEDAVESICTVLEDDETADQLREHIPDASAYSSARFRSEFADLVARKLQQSPS